MNTEISGGGFLSVVNIGTHVTELGSISLPSPDVTVAALAALGVAVVARRRDMPAKLLLVVAALGGALVVLAYDRFAERMLLAPTLSALPLAARATARGEVPLWRRIPSDGLAIAAAISFGLAAWGRLPALGSPVEPQLLETRIAARVGRAPLPTDALFVAEQPSVLAAVGIDPVMSAADALVDEARLVAAVKSGRSVYFLRDMYCERDFAGGGAAPRCERILERFVANAVVEEHLNVRRYALFELVTPVGNATLGKDD